MFMSFKLSPNSLDFAKKNICKMSTSLGTTFTFQNTLMSSIVGPPSLGTLRQMVGLWSFSQSFWLVFFIPRGRLIPLPRRLRSYRWVGDWVSWALPFTEFKFLLQPPPALAAPEPLLCPHGSKDSVLLFSHTLLEALAFAISPMLCISNHQPHLSTLHLRCNDKLDTHAIMSHHVLNQGSLAFSSLNLVPSF